MCLAQVARVPELAAREVEEGPVEAMAILILRLANGGSSTYPSKVRIRIGRGSGFGEKSIERQSMWSRPSLVRWGGSRRRKPQRFFVP